MAKHLTCPRRCNTCLLQWEETEFQGGKGTRYRLAPFNCKLTNVVYIIHCQLCNMNYVGMTSNILRSRINNHLSNIMGWKNTSVAEHFLTNGHDVAKHFRVAIIDNCNQSESTKIREGFWISALNTVNTGIN